MKKIYLDYNATTPVDPVVTEAIIPFLREHFGNPSSAHIYGRIASEAISEARESVASMISSMPEEIIFTGSGTESNNLALRGLFVEDAQQRLQGHLIISSWNIQPLLNRRAICKNAR